ncbi:RHS repeat-associated core domain-containing protein [Paucidesulfovibrio longus]|uniref:RHS repeat-associated core domain-containing protein n=1 Tax=Paucidesulfovibrio longus TaxID=889 RepID=UPI0009DB9586|nr:RHS repeat-associated core domain-containing protein [Paucidesulfovibrio longus]
MRYRPTTRRPMSGLGIAEGHVLEDQRDDQGQPIQILLHMDHIGSVRMVEFPTEGMVKEILYDWDTGRVRFGWRDYDPDTGRFTAKDPIGAAGGDSEWYGYCSDDPVNGRDPQGLETNSTQERTCEEKNPYCKGNECTEECQVTGTYQPITERDAREILEFPIPVTLGSGVGLRQSLARNHLMSSPSINFKK